MMGFVANFLDLRSPVELTWFGAAAAVLGLCVENSCVRTFLNIIGEVVCCIELTKGEKILWYHLWYIPTDLLKEAVYPFFWFMAASFFFLLEIDRVSGEMTAVEARRLRKGYGGSIKYAECARQSDAVKILQEIDDQQDAVDFAIHVLLTAGMSTPALRHIAEAGVDIEFAAYSEITAAAILLVPFSLLTIVNFVFHIKYFQGDWAILILQGTSILGRLILVSIIYRSPTDEQCFLLKLLTKFAAMLVFALALFIPAIWLPDIYPLLVWLFTFDIGLLCMIPVAVLGIQGTAERLPLGLCLLQLVFARGCKAFLSCYSKVQRCCFSQKQLTTQSSSDSDSSAEWFYEHFLVGAESYHWVRSCM